jgi:hypothetical protein
MRERLGRARSRRDISGAGPSDNQRDRTLTAGDAADATPI